MNTPPHGSDFDLQTLPPFAKKMLEKRYGSLQNVPPEIKRQAQENMARFTLKDDSTPTNSTQVFLADPGLNKSFRFARFFLIFLGPVGWILFLIFSFLTPQKVSKHFQNPFSPTSPVPPPSSPFSTPSVMPPSSMRSASPFSFTSSPPVSSYSSHSSPIKTDNGLARAIFIIGFAVIAIAVYFVLFQMP